MLDRRNGAKDCITFEIELVDTQFVASHEALTLDQEQSGKIASVKCTIDPDFSLDENLQELYEDCSEAIDKSEYYYHWHEQWDTRRFYLLPAYLAPYLINSDCGGMGGGEIAEINDYLHVNGLQHCEGILYDTPSFCTANDLNNLACDCYLYIFNQEGEE